MSDDINADMSAEGQLRETRLSSERVYEGSRLSLRIDQMQMADGRRAAREIVEHPDAVVILAWNDDGQIAFVRQWRAPVERPLLELPAGRIDPGETPEQAARRELREEVGLEPGALEPVREFYVAPGWATEYLYGFVARDCVAAPLPPDEDEELIVEWRTLGEAVQLIESGEIVDAKSQILLQSEALAAVGPLARKIVHHYRGG